MNKLMIVVMFSFFFLPLSVSAEVVIEQVYYFTEDDSNHEFILLKNRGDANQNLDGWNLLKPTSSNNSAPKIDARLPDVTLLPNQTFLIADVGWNEHKLRRWPTTDLEDELSLNNEHTGITLSNADNTTIDAVGWGDINEIAVGFYEGTPHPGVSERGQALLRVSDTDNNTKDFIITQPSLQSLTSATIPFSITVINALPTIHEIIIVDDDESKKGNQILPQANKERVIPILVITDASKVTASLSASETTATPSSTASLHSPKKLSRINKTTFGGNLSLSYVATPDDYSIHIKASNDQGSSTEQALFTYLPLIAFSLDATPFVTELIQNTSYDATSILKNTGNVAINTELWSTENSLAISYKYATQPFVSINATPKRVDINLAPNSSLPISFRFNANSTVAPSLYAGVIHFSALQT